MKELKNIYFIFPVMGYYLLEAAIVGIFLMVVWNFALRNILPHINYIEASGIYWIAKMLFFDVFKLIGGLTQMNQNLQNNLYNEN